MSGARGSAASASARLAPLLALLLVACAPLPPFGPAAHALPVAPPATTRLLPFQTIDHGADGGVTDARRAVVRDRTAWSLLWEQVTVGRSPIPRLPAVDFEKEMVLGVFLGLRRSAGYGVEIVALEESATELLVRVRETAPVAGADTAQMLTAPYHLVRAARTDKAVRFVTG